MSEPNPRLTVSDWVTFLSNESSKKEANMSSFLTFSAIMVALIAVLIGVLYSSPIKIWWEIMAIAETCVIIPVVLEVVWHKVYRPVDRRSTDAQNILRRIMSGEFTQEEEIRREWEKTLTKEREGKHAYSQDQLMSSVFSWGKALGSAVLAPIVFVLGFLAGLCEPFKCIGNWVKDKKRPWFKQKGPKDKTKT